MLKKIVTLCDVFSQGYVFKAVYLLSFFSFLRLSSLAPNAILTFDPLKHLCRGDVFISKRRASVLVKWSKTLQFGDKVKIIHLPYLANELCPISALKTLLRCQPAGDNLPLFQFHNGTHWIPLTDSRIRKNFKSILQKMELQSSNLTMHSFRRSGATYAFNNNTPLQSIQQHGIWSSDCVWRYICDSAETGLQVASMFERTLTTH